MATYAQGALARNPTIHNVTMTLANNEYSHQLTQNTKAFDIHTRDESEFRMAFETGHVATPTAPYFTVLQNTRYWKEQIDVYVSDSDWDGTIYFASDSTDKVIEVLEWT